MNIDFLSRSHSYLGNFLLFILLLMPPFRVTLISTSLKSEFTTAWYWRFLNIAWRKDIHLFPCTLYCIFVVFLFYFSGWRKVTRFFPLSALKRQVIRIGSFTRLRSKTPAGSFHLSPYKEPLEITHVRLAILCEAKKREKWWSDFEAKISKLMKRCPIRTPFSVV